VSEGVEKVLNRMDETPRVHVQAYRIWNLVNNVGYLAALVLTTLSVFNSEFFQTYLRAHGFLTLPIAATFVLFTACFARRIAQIAGLQPIVPRLTAALD
jgi:hypothetical protein